MNILNRLIPVITILLFLSCKKEIKEFESNKDSTTLENLSLKTPDELLGQFFVDVQLNSIFEDSKTFVDCIAKFPYQEIQEKYEVEKKQPNFDLKLFVLANFELPPDISVGFKSDTTKTASEHVKSLWPILKRASDNSSKTSLIPLPKPYVVPGGRFREVYYWDSYFTFIGLAESGEYELMKNILDNFSYLIETVGHIPNGNRTYYKTRSQPPFFAQMVKLYAEEKGDAIYDDYKDALKKEYEFWMHGNEESNPSYNRCVATPVGVLNRYYDLAATPRQESYLEDFHQVDNLKGGEKMYRDLRAGAESGWDYTSRWFSDGQTIATIETTDIIPIDLNALLYGMEDILLLCFKDDKEFSNQLKISMKARKEFMNNYAFDAEEGYFQDYNWVKKELTNIPSLATMYPLYFNIASKDQAGSVAKYIENNFLKPGGVVTTLTNTGQQWDAPNGWAPLQWMTIMGLENYGYSELAQTIAKRWVELNEKVYKNTGKFVEKYNVVDLTLEAGGGEYPVQDGFGWSNGVYLGLKTYLEKSK